MCREVVGASDDDLPDSWVVMTTTAIAIEAMSCRTLEIIRFGSYYAAKLEGFDPAAIRACIRGKAYTHGGFTWRLASGNPPAPGRYLVRYQWHNRMNGREFDELVVTTWDGEKFHLFSGAKVAEWRFL